MKYLDLTFNNYYLYLALPFQCNYLNVVKGDITVESHTNFWTVFEAVIFLTQVANWK